MANTEIKKHIKHKQMQTPKYLFLILLIIACNSTPNKDYTDLKGESISVVDTVENTQIIKVDSFLVTKNAVGIFKKGMKVKDIVKSLPEKQIRLKIGHGEFQDDNYDDYEIYDVNSQHLLTLTPLVQNDANSTINRIKIIDSRYKTAAGIGIESTYGDLMKAYTPIEYSPDLEHIVLTVNQIGAWFSIKKSLLKEVWWNEKTKEVDKSKIPLDARFDTFIIWWKQ